MSIIQETHYFLYSASKLSKDAWLELWTRPFYTRLFINQLYDIGWRSLPIIFIISASTGMVLSLQYGSLVAKYGNTFAIYVPQTLNVAIFREIAPIFTAIILAGRIGAGIAAEIGAMKASEQIDAIRALGTSPIKRLVIPRILAALIAVPCLTLFSCIVSYLFGGLGAMYDLNLDFMFFHNHFFDRLDILSMISVLVKPLVFSYLIVITGCCYGFSVSGRGRSVGEVTTLSVVVSSVLIVTANFFLTKILLELVG